MNLDTSQEGIAAASFVGGCWNVSLLKVLVEKQQASPAHRLRIAPAEGIRSIDWTGGRRLARDLADLGFSEDNLFLECKIKKGVKSWAGSWNLRFSDLGFEILDSWNVKSKTVALA